MEVFFLKFSEEFSILRLSGLVLMRFEPGGTFEQDSWGTETVIVNVDVDEIDRKLSEIIMTQ